MTKEIKYLKALAQRISMPSYLQWRLDMLLLREKQIRIFNEMIQSHQKNHWRIFYDFCLDHLRDVELSPLIIFENTFIYLEILPVEDMIDLNHHDVNIYAEACIIEAVRHLTDYTLYFKKQVKHHFPDFNVLSFLVILSDEFTLPKIENYISPIITKKEISKLIDLLNDVNNQPINGFNPNKVYYELSHELFPQPYYTPIELPNTYKKGVYCPNCKEFDKIILGWNHNVACHCGSVFSLEDLCKYHINDYFTLHHNHSVTAKDIEIFVDHFFSYDYIHELLSEF